jgi:hypothetical protein
MPNFLGIHTQPQTLDQSGLGSFNLLKSPAPDYTPRRAVRHTEDNRAASFVGHRRAILHQLLEMEVVLRLL